MGGRAERPNRASGVAALVAAVALAATLAGCGSSGSSSSESAAPSAAAPSSVASSAGSGASAGSPSPSTSVADVCSALTPAQVQAVLGYASGGQGGGGGGSDAFGLAYCTWGSPEKGALLALQVFTPGAVQDPLSLLVGSLPGEPTPVAGLPDGKQYAAGIMPGGGGVGSTVTWTGDGRQYALGMVASNLTAEQQRALAVAAGQVSLPAS